MRRLFILLLGLTLILPFAFSQDNLGISEQGAIQSGQDNQATTISIIEFKNQLSAMQAKIDKLPPEADIDSSFQQLDAKISGIVLQQIVLFMVVLVLNDALFIAVFLLLKSRELI